MSDETFNIPVDKDELLKEAIKKMKANCFTDDFECNGIDADAILCSVLNKLGFSDLTEVFDEVERWYS